MCVCQFSYTNKFEFSRVRAYIYNMSKIYKAIVTKISIPDKKGQQQRRIYVSPLPYRDFVKPRVANPPTPIPTSKYGSGMISYPEIGQECIVFEESGHRQILSYTRPARTSPYGQLIPQNLSEGATTLTADGLKPASLILGKNGQISMFSNLFAQISVDGDQGEVLFKGKMAKIEALGGFQHYLYDKNSKDTQFLSVYYKKKENPGFTDVNKRIEQGYGKLLPKYPSQYTYVDKALVLAGHIPGHSHLYEIQTRQGINNVASQDKTVTTSFKVGYQEKHERYNGISYAAGSILELSAKKNIKGDTGLFKLRYGKLADDNANSVDRGEVFGIYIYEGTNNNLPYGSQVKDPSGEGKGWGIQYSQQHNYKYIHSFGKLRSGSTQLKGSLHRNFLWDKEANLSKLDVIGGPATLQSELAHEDINIAEIIGKDSLQTYIVKNKAVSFLRALDSDKIFHQKVTKGNTSYVQEFVEGNLLEAYQTGSTNYSRAIKNKTLTISFEDNGKKETIEVKSDNVRIENNSGATFTLEKDDIVFKTGGSELKITPKGLTFNKKALAFEDLIDILANAPAWTVGAAPGTNEPPFPSLVTQLRLPKLRTN